MEQLHPYRLTLFVGFLTLMALAESAFRARGWDDARAERWRFHLGLAAFNTVVYRLTAAIPVVFVVALCADRGWGLSRILGLEGGGEIIAALIALDFLDYVWHRANHAVPFLWRFHRAHHTDTHVDVSTSLRFHIGELLLSGVVKCLWILVWGPSLLAFVIFEAAITIAAQFHHSNIDLHRFEHAFRSVVMTPRLHTAHHTVTLRSRDANFSTIFLWWDYIFGSFAEADVQEMETLGLSEGRATHLSFKEFLRTPMRVGP